MDWTHFAWACGLTFGGLGTGFLLGSLGRRPRIEASKVTSAQECLRWFLVHRFQIGVYAGRYSTAECLAAMQLLAHADLAAPASSGEEEAGG